MKPLNRQANHGGGGVNNEKIIELHKMNGRVVIADRGWGKIIFFDYEKGTYKGMIHDYHQKIKRIGRVFKAVKK